MDDVIERGDHVDVVALVLGQVCLPERSAMAAHLLSCSDCRNEYDDLSAVVADIVPATPAVQPTLGFDQRVLQRLAAPPVVLRRATSRRACWVAAAAIVLVTLTGVAAWSLRSDPRSVAATRALTTVSGGVPVGTVSFGEVADESIMVVALVDPPAGVAYRCRITFADGSTTASDPWPSVRGAWIVPLHDATPNDVRTVELVVDGSDHVWSSMSVDQ